MVRWLGALWNIGIKYLGGDGLSAVGLVKLWESCAVVKMRSYEIVFYTMFVCRTLLCHVIE